MSILLDLIRDAIYNRELYKSGKANKNEVRSTTIGWRRDPINRGDGYTSDAGNERTRKDGNGTDEYDTPSGNHEYYRIIRKKK